MSNLAAPVSNGRTQNGGSRAAGVGGTAVPVPPYAAPAEGSPNRVRTPTEIMRARRDREAERKQENDRRIAQQEEENQRRLQAENRQRAQEENARLERESAAAGGAPPAPRTSARSSREGPSRRSGGDPAPQPTERRPGDRVSGGSTRANIPATAQPAPYQQPSSRPERTSSLARENDPAITNIQPPRTRTRPRGNSDNPRPIENTRAQQTPRTVSAAPAIPGSTDANAPQTRQSSKVAGSLGQLPNRGPPPPDQPSGAEESVQGSQQRSNKSSFPHAFERWEQLSAHWEGLTSFWIRRLQQSQEELDKGSLNQQLARQVTDLSAAGANLFHAVVELQRLRASSERKFQRWFFETRSEQERSREIQAKLEEQIRSERDVRAETATRSARDDTEIKKAYAAKATADVQVREMKRELAISKDEARRAWEELGRMVQDERDRTISLKNGEPTLVGGVQVVPMVQGVSRQASTNQPPTRDGPTSNNDSRQQGQGQRDVRDEPGYTRYDAARSETDTDPFTEGGRANQQVREDPNLPTSYPYQQTSNSSSAAVQAARAATQAAAPLPSNSTRTTTTTTTTSGNSSGTYLRYGPDGSTQGTNPTNPSSFYQHEGSSLHPDERGQSRISEGDERSYVPSVEDTLSDEFELDSNGEVVRDSHGHPIIDRRAVGSEDSDEYNVQEQLEREQMYGRSYGSTMPGVEYGSGPTSGSGRTQPDYAGQGYGSGWEAMPRHHHPTRLSDVLEEDERSRTSPSRASQNSRGIR